MIFLSVTRWKKAWQGNKRSYVNSSFHCLLTCFFSSPFTYYIWCRIKKREWTDLLRNLLGGEIDWQQSHPEWWTINSNCHAQTPKWWMKIPLSSGHVTEWQILHFLSQKSCHIHNDCYSVKYKRWCMIGQFWLPCQNIKRNLRCLKSSLSLNISNFPKPNISVLWICSITIPFCDYFCHL